MKRSMNSALHGIYEESQKCEQTTVAAPSNNQLDDHQSNVQSQQQPPPETSTDTVPKDDYNH